MTTSAQHHGNAVYLINSEGIVYHQHTVLHTTGRDSVMENNQRNLQGTGMPVAPEVPTVDSYLERAAMFLEDRDWSKADEYCEKVLDINPKKSQAYLYKLLVQLRVTQPDRLIDQLEPFYHLDACQKAVRFGDAGLQATLANYNAQVTARKEEALYQTGCSLMA